MKAVTSKPELRLDDDPRILDREHKQRLRVMVHTEKIKGCWANVLYTLRDCGRITREQADAGDKYWTLRRDWVREMTRDPQDELSLRRVKRVKDRYSGAIESLGLGRKYVDEVVFENIWPVGEAGHLAVARGLEVLRIFFDQGTKRERKKAANVV